MQRLQSLVFLLVLAILLGCISQSPPETKPTMTSSKWIVKEGLSYGRNATAIIIEAPNCTSCDYYRYVLSDMEGSALGTDIVDVRSLPYGSSEANLLMEYYKIEKLPTLILKKNDEWDYRTLGMWADKMGTLEGDNALVLREVYPPYYDVKTGEVKGLVSMVLLVNGSDTEAAAAADAVALQYKFVYRKKELNASDAEAQRTMASYNITKLPAVLISPDAADYPGFTQAWLDANKTVEKDGTFVLR